MYLKLAWRNLWRNSRRTIITMASIFFAVILSTFMMSIKEGVYVNMLDAMVGAYTGYVQVHGKGYWEEQSLDNGMLYTEDLQKQVLNTPGVNGFLPRVEGFALSYAGELTKGAMVVGIDPVKESEFTQLNERVTDGEYLMPQDKSVMIGAGLAEYLKVGVGDTVVIIGQGYHGASAAGKYPIKALIKFGSPELSKQLIFLPISEAQWYFDTGNLLTTMILQLDDITQSKPVADALGAQLGAEFEVMDWKELVPDIISLIETDRVEGYVFMFILYMVISFGIFGTVLMMLAERKYEFGVLVAVGMKRIKLALVVWVEVIIISVLGALVGMLGAFPLCYYFHTNPIDMSGGDMEKMYEEYGMEASLQASVDVEVFTLQASVVFLVACAIAVYPFITIMRIKAINAMKH